jgi:hypothetical protein
MPNGGGHVDLFVIDSTRFRDFTPSETAQFAGSGGVETAIWCKGDKTYLLAGNLNQERLQKLL